MKEEMKWAVNEYLSSEGGDPLSLALSKENILKVKNFFTKFNDYKPTPLHSLRQLSQYLGVGSIYVKDESYRMGLNAFKVLGSCYAVARRMAEKLGRELEDLSFEELKSEDAGRKTGDIVLTTATDGNHGRGLAWTAKQLGRKAVIYMPKGTAQKRIDNIKALGAEVIVTDKNYNDSSKIAMENALKNGWELVQDTAWEGYEEIPLYIMQGYGIILLEVMEQLEAMGENRPTHVFVQAGVGTLAGTVIGFFADAFKEERPIMVVVEPKSADCIYRSVKEGSIQAVNGSMETIMAGLACGIPNPQAWELIKRYGDMAVSLPEYYAAQGMRILANPLESDPRIVSGESGAVTTGFLSEVMLSSELKDVKKALKLDNNSRILLISTEGETDPVNYRKIVWNGYFPLER